MREAGGAASSGIAFETDPQAGAWLYVETTGTDPASGAGLNLVNAHAVLISGEGIELTSPSTSIVFNAPDFLFTGDASGNDDFLVSVGGHILLTPENSAIQLAMQAGVGIQLYTTAGPVRVPQGDFRVNGLPIVDPGNSGQFWNSAGTVKVSP